jgi:hypothetical protein
MGHSNFQRLIDSLDSIRMVAGSPAKFGPGLSLARHEAALASVERIASQALEEEAEEDERSFREHFEPWAHEAVGEVRRRIVQALGEMGDLTVALQEALEEGEPMLAQGARLDRLGEVHREIASGVGFVVKIEDEIANLKRELP